jgi:hypothetical protein
MPDFDKESFLGKWWVNEGKKLFMLTWVELNLNA